jgi:hypothetical protein
LRHFYQRGPGFRILDGPAQRRRELLRSCDSKGQCRAERLRPTVVFNVRTSKLYKRIFRILKLDILPAFTVVLTIYVLLTLTSHVAFNLRDAAGFVCTETENPITVKVKDTQVVKKEPSFGPSSLCWASGLQLVRSFRYEITIERDQSVPWHRNGYETDLAGFDISSLPSIFSLEGLYARTTTFLEVPIRRVWPSLGWKKMPDATAPSATFFTLPGVVNVGGGNQPLSFTLGATDDLTGVSNATISFDKVMTFVDSSGNLFSGGGFGDSQTSVRIDVAVTDSDNAHSFGAGRNVTVDAHHRNSKDFAPKSLS